MVISHDWMSTYQEAREATEASFSLGKFSRERLDKDTLGTDSVSSGFLSKQRDK